MNPSARLQEILAPHGTVWPSLQVAKLCEAPLSPISPDQFTSGVEWRLGTLYCNMTLNFRIQNVFRFFLWHFLLVSLVLSECNSTRFCVNDALNRRLDLVGHWRQQEIHQTAVRHEEESIKKIYIIHLFTAEFDGQTKRPSVSSKLSARYDWE